MRIMLALFRRELRLATRGGHIGLIIAFLLLVAVLLPLALGPNLPLLRQLGPGLIWIGVLLAILLSLDRLFQEDLEDGSLEQYALLDMPLEFVVLAKCAAHWVGCGGGLLLATPLVGLLFNLDAPTLGRLMLALFLGTVSLTLLGALGAALAVSVRRGSLLAVLLIMPLYIPLLIFGSAATTRAGVLLLALIGLACLLLLPVVIAAILRIAIAR